MEARSIGVPRAGVLGGCAALGLGKIFEIWHTSLYILALMGVVLEANRYSCPSTFLGPRNSSFTCPYFYNKNTNNKNNDETIDYVLRNSDSYVLPQCSLSVFKRSFMNWCLFTI